jgi:hypothetical protein
MSLVAQAKNNALPDVQEMDIETIDWIRNNEYSYFNLEGPHNFNFPINIKHHFQPKEDWFLQPKLFNLIHGNPPHIKSDHLFAPAAILFQYSRL